MNPTRPVNLESGLRPAAATPAVSLTGERRSPQPQLAPDVARLRPLDRDAALRILIEEVKVALVEQFGNLPAPPALSRAGADSADLLSDLARLLQALLSDVGGDDEERAASTLARAEDAVAVGGRRALDAIALMPQAGADVRDAVEQLRWLLVRMVDVQARALRARVKRRPLPDTDSESRLPQEVERDAENPAS
ncbi:MAG TPA: hypothetical protein VE046_08120 [Steroidobacteraceae bacterium]|nr:hypothetical protein [Steroidobacteraceae bacterium]